MKITFTNFRCYTYREFTFPNNGLTLLSGPSGKGKSSIIIGIIFALYGIGKKLCTRGSKSCKVEIEYLSNNGLINIIRSKTPNRLLLEQNGKKYEDNVAQSIIDSIFGKNFPDVSFVDNRNLYKTFLMLTPTEKIKFLEGFALRKTDLGLIKNRIKEEIHKNNIALSEIKIKIRNTRDTLEQFEEPKEVIFPLKFKDREKCISNEKVKLKNTCILLKRKQKEISTLTSKLAIIKEKIYKNECNTEIVSKRENEILEINEKIKELSYNHRDEDISSMEKTLCDMQKQLEIITLRENVLILREKVQIMEKTERTELRDKILSLKEKIRGDPKKLRDELSILYGVKPKFIEYEKDKLSLKKYDEIDRDDIPLYEEKIVLLETNLDSLKKDLNLAELRKESMNCPKCNTVLYLDEDKLVELSGLSESKIDIPKIKEKINLGKKELTFLKNSVNELNGNLIIKDKLEENMVKCKTFIKEKGFDVNISLKKINEDITKLEEILIILEKDIFIIQDLETKFKKGEFSPSFRDMKKELEHKEKELEKYPNTIENISKNDIFIFNEKLEKIKKDRDVYNQLNILKNKNVKDMNFFKDKLEKVSNDDYLFLNNNLTTLNKELEELENKYAVHKSNMENIEKYMEYEKIRKTFDNIRGKIIALEDEENVLVKKYEAGIILKEKVLTAESLCIKNIIENINKFTNYYLSKFFIDDSLEIELVSFKEDKSNSKSNVNKENLGKPSINVKLFLNGEECDLTSISGGELSRLILAFTLALNEIFESPMILLDETTANLDDVNTQNVFECIEEHFKDKFILVSAHQVIEGSYENVVYL